MRCPLSPARHHAHGDLPVFLMLQKMRFCSFRVRAMLRGSATDATGPGCSQAVPPSCPEATAACQCGRVGIRHRGRVRACAGAGIPGCACVLGASSGLLRAAKPHSGRAWRTRGVCGALGVCVAHAGVVTEARVVEAPGSYEGGRSQNRHTHMYTPISQARGSSDVTA